MADRKKDHIDLAFQSQIEKLKADKRFYYEPLLGNFNDFKIPEKKIAGKKLKYPIWISSMTGGTKKAAHINKNLAKICNEYGFGMALGSCRMILKDKTHFEDFNIRKHIGLNQPFFANLGIAQIELIIKNKETILIEQLLNDLQADGIIIHINPLQEWIQPEGDTINRAPIETIKAFLQHTKFPIIVKEVGQGFGPESIKQLLQLPLEAIEFASFGGTNFAKVEMWRREKNDKDLFEPLAFIGHTAYEMLAWTNNFVESNLEIKTKNLIISGGISSFLDGYYLTESSKIPAIYGQASAFLKHSMGNYEDLQHFAKTQTSGLQLAYNLLALRPEALKLINN